MIDTQDGVISIQEFADAYGVSRAAVQDWATLGKIPCWRVPRPIRIPVWVLHYMLKHHNFPDPIKDAPKASK